MVPALRGTVLFKAGYVPLLLVTSLSMSTFHLGWGSKLRAKDLRGGAEREEWFKSGAE